MLKHLAFLLIGSSSLYASNYKQDLDRLTYNSKYTRSLKDIGEVAANAFEDKDYSTIDDIIYILSCGKSLGFNKSLKGFSGIGADGTYTDYSIATWIMDNTYNVSKDSFKYINYYGENADFISTYYKTLCLLDYKIDEKPKHIKTKEEIEKEETDKAVNKILDAIDSGEMSIDDLIKKGKAEANGNETLLIGWDLSKELYQEYIEGSKKEFDLDKVLLAQAIIAIFGSEMLEEKDFQHIFKYAVDSSKNYKKLSNFIPQKVCFASPPEKYNIQAMIKIVRNIIGYVNKFDDESIDNFRRNYPNAHESFYDISWWKKKILSSKNEAEVQKIAEDTFKVHEFPGMEMGGQFSTFKDSEKILFLVKNKKIKQDYLLDKFCNSIPWHGCDWEPTTKLFNEILGSNYIDIRSAYHKLLSKLKPDESDSNNAPFMIFSIIDKGIISNEELSGLKNFIVSAEYSYFPYSEEILTSMINTKALKEEDLKKLWHNIVQRKNSSAFPVILCLINQHILRPDELRKGFNVLKNKMGIDLANAFLSQKDDAGFYVFSDKEIMDFLEDTNYDIQSSATEEIRNNRQWLRDLLPNENQSGHTVNYATASETIGAVDYLGGIEAINSIYKDKINNLQQNDCVNTIFEKLHKIADTDKRNKINTEIKRAEIIEHYRHIVAILGDNADNWEWFFAKMYDCSIANGINRDSCRPLAFMIDGLSLAMPSLTFYLQKAKDSAALEQVKNRKYNTEEDEKKLKESIRINKIITNMFFNKQFIVDLATKYKTIEKINEELIKQFKKESNLDPDEEQLDKIKSISSFYIEFIKDEKNLSKLSKQSQSYRELKRKIWKKMSTLSFAVSSNEERKQAFESMEGDIIAYVKNEMSEGNLIIPKELAAHNKIDIIPNYIRQIFVNLGVPENECDESNDTHIIRIDEKTTLSDAIEALARKIDTTEEENYYKQILKEARKENTEQEQLKTIAKYLGLAGYDDRLEEFKNLKNNEVPKINIKNTKEEEAVLDIIKTFNEIASKL